MHLHTKCEFQMSVNFRDSFRDIDKLGVTVLGAWLIFAALGSVLRSLVAAYPGVRLVQSAAFFSAVAGQGIVIECATVSAPNKFYCKM